tara:strand:- start:4742 stop:5221 length:480 start_codon:yes stop_codon:yes gene_type:complete
MDKDHTGEYFSQISKKLLTEKLNQYGGHHSLYCDDNVCVGLFNVNEECIEQELSYLEYLFVFLIRDYSCIFNGTVPPIKIIPQYKINNYRVDFYLKSFKECLIELDGFAYHDRNKYQFNKERQRQNEIILTGIPLLRFTFDDVTKEPMKTINQITEIIG